MKVYEAIKDLELIHNISEFLIESAENVKDDPNGIVVLSTENALELGHTLLRCEEVLKNANLETH